MPDAHLPGRAPDAVRAAHHQIGNSLQSVASLLRLESLAAPPAAAAILNEAGRRVRTVMRLHQQLQETGGEVVRLDDLLGSVCRDVAELDALDRDAEIHVDACPLCAAPRTASAVAMIAAEWVGNALEHGLARGPGQVRVTLEPTREGARLTVSDNGLGATDGAWRPGFGLALFERLARQVRGAVWRTVDGSGSRLVLDLPDVWSERPGKISRAITARARPAGSTAAASARRRPAGPAGAR